MIRTGISGLPRLTLNPVLLIGGFFLRAVSPFSDVVVVRRGVFVVGFSRGAVGSRFADGGGGRREQGLDEERGLMNCGGLNGFIAGSCSRKSPY